MIWSAGRARGSHTGWDCNPWSIAVMEEYRQMRGALRKGPGMCRHTEATEMWVTQRRVPRTKDGVCHGGGTPAVSDAP